LNFYSKQVKSVANKVKFYLKQVKFGTNKMKFYSKQVKFGTNKMMFATNKIIARFIILKISLRIIIKNYCHSEVICQLFNCKDK